MRPVESPARSADQQRQTHWRSCGGGPVGNAELDVSKPVFNPKSNATSQTKAATTTVGACDCAKRLAGSAASR
jgi:hypothetical protein